MKFGSLFSGIGGMDLGLERAGFQCAWQVEIDEYATKVLTKHWPSVPKFRDVRECGRHNLERVDVIAGGFPCQPHSHAGKRLASEDPRDLWGEFARVVDEIRPKWVLAENVRSLLSSESGRYFGRVLRDLAHMGYDAEWGVLSACAFGAPFTRERVFIIAFPNSDGRDRQGLSQEQRARVFSSPRGARGASGTPLPESEYWKDEPGIVGVVDGVPNRVDRIRGAGNAVVPDKAEWLGKLIIKADQFSRAQ